MALMGRDRILDFIINHLLPMKDDEHAWKHYLSLRAGQAGTKVLSVHPSFLKTGRRTAPCENPSQSLHPERNSFFRNAPFSKLLL